MTLKINEVCVHVKPLQKTLRVLRELGNQNVALVQFDLSLLGREKFLIISLDSSILTIEEEDLFLKSYEYKYVTIYTIHNSERTACERNWISDDCPIALTCL